ncbi:MAG: PTS sugar transporter subunit IIA [Magnetococcus sp. DMHC-8]
MDMQIAQLITPSRVIANLNGTTVTEVLSALANLLARDLRSVSAQEVLAVLLEREGLGSTAIGQGVAIPHGRLAGLATPMAAMGRSSRGIAFHAPDDEPVHLVIALLSPMEDNAVHLQALSRIAHLLRRDAVRQRLQLISEPGPLFHALLAEEEA